MGSSEEKNKHLAIIAVNPGEYGDDYQNELRKKRAKGSFAVGTYAVGTAVYVAGVLAISGILVWEQGRLDQEALKVVTIFDALFAGLGVVSVVGFVNNLKKLIRIISKESFCEVLNRDKVDLYELDKYINGIVNQKLAEAQQKGSSSAPDTFVQFGNDDDGKKLGGNKL